MGLRLALLLLAPFALVGIWHYLRYATLTPAGRNDVLGRARAAAVARQQQKWSAHATSSAGRSAVVVEPPAAARVEKPRLRGALSSEAATARVLEAAGLHADSIEGLGDVTTAEEFVAKLPEGATVWLTFSNRAYLHFAQNWYMQARAVGRQHHVVVAALDAFTLESWRSLRVPVLNFTEFGDASDFRGIGSDQARFRRMGAMKVAAFHRILLLGRSVLVSDVDTVWLKDPTDFLSSPALSQVDIAVTSDCLSREADSNKRGDNPRFGGAGVWFCGHNPGNRFGATFNTGVMFLRPTSNALSFTERWRAKLLAPTEDWHLEDQRAFNMMVMENFYPTLAAPGVTDGSVVLAANKTLQLMPLPAGKFCGGHTFFVQQSGEARECMNVHVTFTEGGVHGKLWRLKEAGLWNLEPSGYFHDGRYLSFKPPRIPRPLPPKAIEPFDQCTARIRDGKPADPKYINWWSSAGSEKRCVKPIAQYQDKNGDQGVTIDEALAMSPRLQAHMKMADRYLTALRDGMSMAWILNRTFVFPKFECMCDRSEWPDIMPTCRLANSDLEFPFGCPLNFLINVHFMQGLEEGTEGRHGVPYREHSFLSNSRLSSRLRESRARVSFEEQPVVALEAKSTASDVFLPRRATDDEVRRLVGPGTRYHDTAVLMLEEAEDVLGGFENGDDGTYIRALLDSKVLYGSWCCSRTNFHHPGATAFFNRPASLPVGHLATQYREKRGW
ncbi:hypothetical protein AB1Y20_017328 [Prymnesium parvum]|uniref:Nucleotide-diphospho-sugar transferase domain-containing protein n=1 Tax=Prymnesium parvum TaxID=97485 RepID=A0AB34JK64_PRYPA